MTTALLMKVTVHSRRRSARSRSSSWVRAIGGLAYSASKWAVRGMTKVAARDLGSYGIRVNSIHPGYIGTDMSAGGDPERRRTLLEELPISRVGTVNDIASLALFLASDESSYCTGAEFVIDGGWTA